MSESMTRIDRLWHDSAIWVMTHSIEILVAVAVAGAIVAVLVGIRALGIRACRNDRMGTEWPGVIGRSIARTRLWFMIALSAELVAGSTSPPSGLVHIISMAFTVAITLQAALWARELVLGIIDHRAGADPDNHTLGSAIGLIRLLVTIALFAIALVLILDNLGVNVTGLVAGLGIGGIAIGLAAQGIFSDLFAALSIIFDKPFRIGELVSWDQNVGTVETIGLKTTRVRSASGELIIVANANLLQKELRNLTHLEHRRLTITFGIIYQTPPDICAGIPEMLGKMVATHRRCSFTRCSMAGFGPSSLDYELVLDALTHDLREAADIKSEICIAMLRMFSEAKISFAYPTQTTLTAAPDGTLVMPWAPPQGK